MRLKQTTTALELQEGKLSLLALPRQSYSQMLHGPGTDRIVEAMGARIIEGRGTLQGRSGTLRIKGDKSLNACFGASTIKLLRWAQIAFTEVNQGGGEEQANICKEVSFPLEEFMELCGYNEPGPHGRIYHIRKIRKDLEILHSACYSLKHDKDFLDVSLVQAKGIHKGNICIQFSDPYSRYMNSRHVLTQRSHALFRVSEKSPHALKLGEAIDLHYNITGNHERGIAEALKVETLLEDTTIPSLEEVRRARKAWREKMLSPFEQAMEELVKCGYLKAWRYSTKTGEAPEEGETWLKTTIRYTLATPPDHSEDLKRLQERREKRAKELESTPPRRSRKHQKG